MDGAKKAGTSVGEFINSFMSRLRSVTLNSTGPIVPNGGAAAGGEHSAKSLERMIDRRPGMKER